MSQIKTMKVNAFDYKVNIETFNSAAEVVEVNKNRKITDSSFHDMPNCYIHMDFHGVNSFEEAMNLMKTGYQPTVDKMQSGIKANLAGQAKRVSFKNDVVGFSPIVPLALQGVPNCMVNSYMKTMKAKVIDVYYDMTCSCNIESSKLTKVGQELLGAVMELEMQGYRFNLYACQSYSDEYGADILVTKIKSSNTPLDLKRISFPLTHPAYFRVIGFDWYSKMPLARYRWGYGQGIGSRKSEEIMQAGYQEMFGKNCRVFSAAKVLHQDKDQFKTVLEGGGK